MSLNQRPEYREQQLVAIVENLDNYYDQKVLNYTQLEETIKKLPLEEIESLRAYTRTEAIREICDNVTRDRTDEPVSPPPVQGIVPPVEF